MPHIVHPLGEAADRLAAGTIHNHSVDTTIRADLAWVLDPYAPVPLGVGEDTPHEEKESA